MATEEEILTELLRAIGMNESGARDWFEIQLRPFARRLAKTERELELYKQDQGCMICDTLRAERDSLKREVERLRAQGGSVVVPPPLPDQVQYVADLIKWREESGKSIDRLERAQVQLGSIVASYAHIRADTDEWVRSLTGPLGEIARELEGWERKP